MPIVFLFFLALPRFALSFPELIRHGYNNCTACHVSPAGGGLLTPYGRSLSREVLSTWGNENEEKFLHNSVDTSKLDEWILFGGDVRSVQVHKETKAIRKGRFIPMEASFSVGLVREKWAVVAKIGELEAEEREWKPELTSFYGLYKPMDELSFRAGKFVPQYGLNLADHIAFTRSFLGFGLEASRPTAEVQWSGETLTANFSASERGPSDEEHGPRLEQKETSVQSQLQFFFADRFKVAANGLQSKSDSLEKNNLGLWSVLGFTPNIFWMNEFDWQTARTKDIETRSFVMYNKFGYTVMKGFDALIIHEQLTADTGHPENQIRRTGPGFQFYPRPHFEFSGAWTKQEGDDYAWLLFHYYL